MESLPLPFWVTILQNRIILASVSGWLVAQSIKVMLGIIREKRFNFRWFVGSGGMPSSHAATVTALATSVGLSVGFTTALFAISAVLAFVIMFDAQGVRRQSGHQAEALNKIFEDIYWNKGIQQDRLKELFGHTPVEVFAGSCIGILMAILVGPAY